MLAKTSLAKQYQDICIGVLAGQISGQHGYHITNLVKTSGATGRHIYIPLGR